MSKETYTSAQIYLAGDNSRRKQFLEHALGRPVATLPAPESAETVSDRTSEIALAKATQAFNQATIRPDHSFIISADTMPYVDHKNDIAFRKPKNEVELMRNFGAVAQKQHEGNTASYDPISHTATAYVNGKAVLEDIKLFGVGSRIRLKPEAAQWLATPTGTAYYLRMFHQFYESKFRYNKVAGFCSILLTAMRAVEEVDLVTLDTAQAQQVHETVRDLTYTLLTPISPQATLYILEKMKGEPLQHDEQQAMFDRIYQWPEIQGTVDRVLEWRSKRPTHPWENSSVTNPTPTR